MPTSRSCSLQHCSSRALLTYYHRVRGTLLTHYLVHEQKCEYLNIVHWRWCGGGSVSLMVAQCCWESSPKRCNHSLLREPYSNLETAVACLTTRHMIACAAYLRACKRFAGLNGRAAEPLGELTQQSKPHPPSYLHPIGAACSSRPPFIQSTCVWWC